MFQIKNRFTDAVLFECELSADVAGKEYRFQLGFAVKKAVEARANLARANLADANLAGANLAGANLARANLAAAYLADANLAGANLARANLAAAYLADAYLADAKWSDGIIINKRPIQLYGLDYSVTILDDHMQIGCELHALSEWSDFDDRRIAQMDGLRSAKFWKAHKEVLLSLAASAGRGVEVASGMGEV